MAGKGKLGAGGEDPRPCDAVASSRWQQKDRLGEVHLAGDGLHLPARQLAGVEEDGQRVAAEDVIGEDVDLHEAVVGYGCPAAHG